MSDKQNVERVDHSLPISEQVKTAIKVLQKAGSKVNPNQVSKLISVSRSALYKLHPNEVINIQKIGAAEKDVKKKVDNEEVIEQLKEEVTELSGKLKQAKLDLAQSESYNVQLREDLQRLYRMYDDLFAERTELQDRLMHLN